MATTSEKGGNAWGGEQSWTTGGRSGPLKGLNCDESHDRNSRKELVEAKRCSVAGVIATREGTRDLVGTIAVGR
jgi:hypothetical protein